MCKNSKKRLRILGVKGYFVLGQLKNLLLWFQIGEARELDLQVSEKSAFDEQFCFQLKGHFLGIFNQQTIVLIYN